MDKYFAKYPGMGGALKAQLRNLLGRTGNGDKIAQQALEMDMTPDVLLAQLQEHFASAKPEPEAPAAKPERVNRPSSGSGPKRGGFFGWVAAHLPKFGRGKKDGDGGGNPGDEAPKPKFAIKQALVVVMVAFVVVFVAYFAYQSGPQAISGISNFHPIRLAGPGGVNFTLHFVELAFIATAVISFLEAFDRKDPLLLDWWMPYVCWALLVFSKSTELTALPAFALGVLFLGAFWNRGEEFEQSWWNRFDASGIFALCFALVLTHLAKWPTVPYPSFIPLPWVVVLGTFALFKEMIRSVWEFIFGVGALLLGVAAGFFMTWTAFLVTLAIAMIAVYAAASQELIPIAGRRGSENKPILNFNVKIIKAWDILFAFWAFFVVSGIYFYGNYVAVILASR